MKKQLGLNINDIALLKQARNTSYPEMLQAAYMAQNAGVDSIIIYEDKNYIQKRDLYLIREACSLPLNLQIHFNNDMVNMALDLCPEEVCLLPEFTDNNSNMGLDILSESKNIERFVTQAESRNINVNMLIHTDDENIKIASELNVQTVTFSTAYYTTINAPQEQQRFFDEITHAIAYANSLGLQVMVGQGLNYENIKQFSAISEIHGFQVGHSILSRAIFVGLDQAIRDFIKLING